MIAITMNAWIHRNCPKFTATFVKQTNKTPVKSAFFQVNVLSPWGGCFWNFLRDLKPQCLLNVKGSCTSQFHLRPKTQSTYKLDTCAKLLFNISKKSRASRGRKMIPLSQMQSKFCFDKMVAKSQTVHLLHPLTVGQWVEWPAALGTRSSAWVALWRKEGGTQQNHVCAQTGVRGEDTTRSFRSASARMGKAEEEPPTDPDQTTTSITLALDSLDS